MYCYFLIKKTGIVGMTFILWLKDLSKYYSSFRYTERTSVTNNNCYCTQWTGDIVSGEVYWGSYTSLYKSACHI